MKEQSSEKYPIGDWLSEKVAFKRIHSNLELTLSRACEESFEYYGILIEANFISLEWRLYSLSDIILYGMKDLIFFIFYN